jgi:S-formylglutathione hydrolase FrmB
MKRIELALITLAFCLASLTSCKGGETPEDQYRYGKLLTGQTMTSTILGTEMRYTIYLPEGYASSGKSYPVLYLLHGMDFNGDNEQGDLAWSSAGNAKNSTDAAINAKDVGDLIVVMPCGFNSFYINGYERGMRFEDYIFQELIPYIEKTYRCKTSRNDRAIAGLSMGGYGATYQGFKHYDKFCLSYSMSGAVEGNGAIETPSQVIDSLLAAEVSKSSFPAYTMECGLQDQLVYSSNVAFDDYLTSKGISHDYITRDGSHTWEFWSVCYPKVLKALGKDFFKP